jgi:TetR/AcrR family fatty acid metabolism transcriptional regulator
VSRATKQVAAPKSQPEVALATAAGAGAGGKAADNPDRRAEIIRAAVEVFATKGYHGCRIADVAKQAGVAYGLVYHYFHNKEELLETVFAQSFGRFAKAVIHLVEGEGTVQAKLEGILGLAFDGYQRDPRAVKVLIFEIVRSPAFRQVDKVATVQKVLEATARLISRAQRAGELRDDVMPFVAAAMLYGSLETTLTSFVLGAVAAQTPEGVQQARQNLLAIFLSGMSPQAKAIVPGVGTVHAKAR